MTPKVVGLEGLLSFTTKTRTTRRWLKRDVMALKSMAERLESTSLLPNAHTHPLPAYIWENQLPRDIKEEVVIGEDMIEEREEEEEEEEVDGMAVTKNRPHPTIHGSADPVTLVPDLTLPVSILTIIDVLAETH